MSTALEKVITERIARVERLLAAQRGHVQRLEAGGFDTSKPLALLKLLESIADQFRAVRRLMQAEQARFSRRPGRAPLPSYRLPSCKRRPSAAKPKRGVPTFACPHCGLALGLSNGALVYDVEQWARRCKRQTLQTPALCQLLPGATARMH